MRLLPGVLMALLLVAALTVVECGVVTVAFLHDGSLNSGGEEAARLLVEEDAPSVLPSGITLQIIEAGSAKCDKDEAVGQLTSLLIANQANPPVAVMGNGCSNSLAATASLAQFYKFPQVTHAGSSTSMDSHTDYPYFLRTCAGDVTLLEVTVALLGAYKIGHTSVLFYDEKSGYHANQASSFVTQYIASSGTIHQTLSFNIDAEASIDAALSSLREDTQQAIVLLAYYYESRLEVHGLPLEASVFHRCGSLCTDGTVWVSQESDRWAAAAATATGTANIQGLFFATAGVKAFNPTFTARLRAKMTDQGGLIHGGYYMYDAFMAVVRGLAELHSSGVVAVDDITAPVGERLMSLLRKESVVEGITGFLSWPSDNNRLYQYSDVKIVSSGVNVLLAKAVKKQGEKAVIYLSDDISPVFTGGFTSIPAWVGCGKGHFHSPGGCSLCSANTWNNATGSDECNVCPLNTVSPKAGSKSIEDCSCKAGSYHPSGASGEPCLPCLAHSVCDGGSAKPSCGLDGGYWVDQAAGKITKVRVCTPSSACIGGTNCSCEYGRTGPLCNVCIKTYNGFNESFYKSGPSCFRCPAWAGAASGSVLGLFVSMLVLGLYGVYALVMRMGKYRRASDKLSVTIRYIQQLSLIISFELSWPVALSVTTSMLMTMTILPMFILVFLSGYGFWYWRIVTTTPSISVTKTLEQRIQDDVGLVGGLSSSGMSKVHSSNKLFRRVNRRVNRRVKKIEQLRDNHFQAFMHLLMLLFLPHCNGFLAYFDCTNLQDGTYRWKTNLDIQCYTGQHQDALPLAIIGLIFFVLGTPLIYLVVLRSGYKMGFQFDFTGPTYFEQQLEQVLGVTKSERVTESIALFCKIDQDQSGSIDREEFEILLDSLRMPTMNEHQMEVLRYEVLSKCQDQNRISSEDMVNLLDNLDQRRAYDARWRPIWLKFGPSTPWWECVLAFQMAVVVSVKIVFANNPGFAGFIALYLFIFFFLLQVVVIPFKSVPGNQVALMCGLCTVLTMVGALAMSSEEPGTANYTTLAAMTVIAVCAGALYIVKNTGSEFYNSKQADKLAKLAACLHSIPIFIDCDPAFVEACSKMMTHESVQLDSTLCTLGDTGDKFWVLMKGSVDLLDDKGHIYTSFTGTDDVTSAFGELSLMDCGLRKFTIVATTPLEVKLLTRTDLRECFAKHPGAENAMLSAVMSKYNGHDQEAVDAAADVKRLHTTDTDSLIDILGKVDDPNDPDASALKKMKHAARLELKQRTC